MSEENRDAEIETLGSVIKRQEQIEARLDKQDERQRKIEERLSLCEAKTGLR